MVVHIPVPHSRQCRWQVVGIKNGYVSWKCRLCPRRQERHVRVYGILPPALLFSHNWPYGIVGCPLCATILNAKAAKCKGKWHLPEETRK